MEWKKLFLLNVFLIQRQAQFVWCNILPKSLLSFLPPAVGVYSLARSSAWKLTRAQKVFQFFLHLSHCFPSLSPVHSFSTLFVFLSCSFPNYHLTLFNFFSPALTFCSSSCLPLTLLLLIYLLFPLLYFLFVPVIFLDSICTQIPVRHWFQMKIFVYNICKVFTPAGQAQVKQSRSQKTKIKCFAWFTLALCRVCLVFIGF